MKKVLSLMAVIAMLLFILTGCVQVNYEVSLNDNGSADVAYVYAFEKETLQQLGTSSEDMTKDMEEQSEKSGYKIEAYSDDTVEGFKASKHFDKSENISLQEAFGESNIKDTEENKIKIEKKGSKTVFSQNAEIDLTSMDESTASMVQMKYTVKLPVKVDKNNAQEVSKDGKTLTWNLKAGEVNKVEFEATKGGISPMVLYIVLAVVAIVIIVVVVILTKNNKEKTEVKEEIKEDKTEE